MAEDPDPVDVDEGILGRQLLDAPLFIGQAVVSEIAIAVIMVPLGALGIAAAIADLDDDKAELGQHGAGAPGDERLGHALGLGAGVDVGDDGIFAGGVEIVGLVHHTIDVGDAVVGLDFERFGILEASFHQGRDVRLFQGQQRIAQSVPQLAPGGLVHAAGVVNDVLGPVVHLRGVHGVAGIEDPQPRAVEIDPVEMHVIGILSRLAAAGFEIEDPGLVVGGLDALAGEFAGRDLRLQLAGAVIQVIMAPAVAFRPPDHLLSAVDQAQGLDFDVGIEDLLDEYLDLARFGVGQANVVAVQVAALAAEVELVGRI